MRNLEKVTLNNIRLDDTEYSEDFYKDKLTGKQIKIEEENQTAYYLDNKLVYSKGYIFVGKQQFFVRNYYDDGKEIYHLIY